MVATTTLKLPDKLKTRIARLAKQTGISESVILKWVNMADLFRVKGIGKQYSELLEKAGVAGVPGSGFGAPGHIRFSFAVSMQTLEQALARMGKALAGA